MRQDRKVWAEEAYRLYVWKLGVKVFILDDNWPACTIVTASTQAIQLRELIPMYIEPYLAISCAP